MSAPTSTFRAQHLSDLAEVRHGLTDELRDAGVPRSTIDDAVVMVSELIANVLGHTDSSASVAVRCDGHDLYVAVSDHSPELPVLRAADPTSVGGNGLRIVDVMADEWGTTSHPGDGKDVWFTLRVA